MAIEDGRAQASRLNAEIRDRARVNVIGPSEEQEPDPRGEAAAGLQQALQLLTEAVESGEQYRITAAELLLDQAGRDWVIARASPEDKGHSGNVDFGAGAAKSQQPEEDMSRKMRRSAGYAA